VEAGREAKERRLLIPGGKPVVFQTRQPRGVGEKMAGPVRPSLPMSWDYRGDSI